MKVCPACDFRFEAGGWTCPSCNWAAAAEAGVPLLAPELRDESDGFDEVSFELLPLVEDESFWFRARNQLIVWALGKYFPQARSFLEVGSGTGFVLRGLADALPDLTLTAGEPSLRGLEITRERVPNAELLQLDARRLPFDEEFAAAGAFDVLEHLDDDERVLTELHRALRPGGGLLATVPQHRWLWADPDEFARHRRRYTRRELRTKLEGAGFEIVRMTSFVSLLLPALAASRIRLRRSSDSYDPLAEYRSARRVRPVLSAIMTIERLLIRTGLSLPAGGSLLAVARKPS